MRTTEALAERTDPGLDTTMPCWDCRACLPIDSKESFGATHRLALRDGGDSSQAVIVAGVRAWF